MDFEALRGYYDIVARLGLSLVVILGFALTYYLLNGFLGKLRARRVIERGLENTIKVLALAVIVIVAVPFVFSILVGYQMAMLFSIAVLALTGLVLALAVKGYTSNIISQLLIVSEGVLREGEYVKIELGSGGYEGRVLSSSGGYLILKDDRGNAIHIPYSILNNSIIVKMTGGLIRVKLKVKGGDLTVERVLHMVESTLEKCKTIDKRDLTVKLLRVGDEDAEKVVIMMVEAKTLNPRNEDKAKEEIVELLVKNIPYETSATIIEEG
ncbi:MAG: mechanosensitive ion channel [Thermoprotei archaeon]|nr:mechanosensitive ion channel [Thermoprotei archaeon]